MEDSYPTFVSENKENLKYKRAMAIVDENIRGRIGNSVFYRASNTGKECDVELHGCKYDKATGKPFPFEGSGTFLPTFGGGGVTKAVVSGSPRKREKRV